MALRPAQRAPVALLLLALVPAACSAPGGTAPVGNRPAAARREIGQRALTAADFMWVAGKKETNDSPSIATCPAGWRMIAGGTQYARDGYVTGIGTVEYGFAGWESGTNYVKTISQDGGRYVSYVGSATAWASCADAAAAAYFTWVHNYARGRDGYVPAGCPSGYVLVTGFATGPGATLPQWAYWQGARNREYWTEGTSTAWASCGSAAVVHVQNLFGKAPAVLQACAPGTVAVGGSSGYRGALGQPSYLGPAQMQFPALRDGSGTGWWVYAGTERIMNHIACAP
jgi:hypothetical protein